MSYLESLAEGNGTGRSGLHPRNDDDDDDRGGRWGCGKNVVSVPSALLRTLRYVNGHDDGGVGLEGGWSSGKATTATVRSLLSSLLLMSSRPDRDVRTIMDAVAAYHPQFRSRNALSSLSLSMAMAGAHEQQDSHEFFLALMDVLSMPTTTTSEGGGDGICYGGEGPYFGTGDGGGRVGLSGIIHGAVDTVAAAAAAVRQERDVEFTKGRRLATTDEFEEEKKHEDNNHNAMEEKEEEVKEEDKKEDCSHPTPSRSFVMPIVCPPSQFPKRATAFPAGFVPPTAPSRRGRNNPFDGWVGSTIKCASCRHVRPVRATPFLGLSLPITNVRSEFVEDYLAAEYGGFRGAERVMDVRCLSCGVMKRARELEMEAAVIDGAISSIRRRRCGIHRGDDDADIAALVRESHLTRRKIAVLGALDPDDADDDNALDYEDDDGDSVRGMDSGIVYPTSRINPIRGDAYRASLLMRPPEVLCIHIQRRHYDPSSGKILKVTRHIRFGDRLDLSPYCAYGVVSFEEEEDRRILPAATSRSDCSARKIPYELMSVIEHVGNACGGHYQTYRRVDSERKEWVIVSDENVASRTWNDVRRCQAYMLFYVATSSINE
ncbi:hypothetical protein ACHAXA_002522 [Cyclostephanos tholiformis]|uniref:ubiquitinyl hydrolase 1 n=1 Tax=Cyclostephanos tholiformis TaxID=382380 RepID=A0ABD3SD94_9STRA